jgi:plasmid maintenance system antidote protein VapI
MTPAELRALLEECGLSQRGAAKALDLDERTMRRYCAGDRTIPLMLALALRWIAHEQPAQR